MAFTGNFSCNVFKTGLMDGVFNFGSGTSDVYKIALYTNQATLDSSTTGYTDVGEVVGTGYSATGEVLQITVSPVNSNNITYLSFLNASWPAAIFTARGALIYKSDGITNPAVCVLDFGSDKTVNGGTFTVEFPPATNTSAIIRLT